MSSPDQQPAQDSLAPLPPWLQNDSYFKSLPHQHQQAILDILQSVYGQFVLQPTDHLERSTGNSVIFLLWRELLKQSEIATLPFDGSARDELARRRLMGDLFRILGTKSNMSSLLVRLRHIKSTRSNSTDRPAFDFPLPQAAP